MLIIYSRIQRSKWKYKFPCIITQEDLFWNRGTAQKRWMDQIAPNFAWITLRFKHFGGSGQIFQFRPLTRVVGGYPGGGWGVKNSKKFFFDFCLFLLLYIRYMSKLHVKHVFTFWNCLQAQFLLPLMKGSNDHPRELDNFF